MQVLALKSDFELLANAYFALHPDINYDWRVISSKLAGDRTDLVCLTNSNIQVWASIRESTIAIGVGETHQDFEGFGRDVHDQDIAQEAFNRFKLLIVQHHFVREKPL